jgi:hypothetical protein
MFFTNKNPTSLIFVGFVFFIILKRDMPVLFGHRIRLPIC